MNSIDKYGIVLRPIKVEDAQFIVDIRNDENKNKYISKTSNDVEQQIIWIEKYKVRENEGKEFYFIAVDKEGVSFSTYRVYDITNDAVEIGSWVSKPGYSAGMNSIKVDLIMKEFVFENLGFLKLNFTVNKQNTNVLKYHKIFQPTILSEDEENYYFELTKENYYLNRNKFFKNIK